VALSNVSIDGGQHHASDPYDLLPDEFGYREVGHHCRCLPAGYEFNL
jgi:hypothetical protein